MKVKCITKAGRTLTEQYLDPRIPVGRDTEFSLTIGREYIVYAVSFYKDQIWYYVIDDHELWYPIRKPAPLFEISDGRVSKSWRMSQRTEPPHFGALLAFDEWLSDCGFYERLTDRSEKEMSIFRTHRKQMDEEFASASR